MFDWLIPLLIVVLLLIKILDYLDLVAAAPGLIVAAIVGTFKLLARLVRSPADRSSPQP